jgi:hypothetical protein
MHFSNVERRQETTLSLAATGRREAQATEDGPERWAAYWESGWAWIAEQRRSRVRP